MSYSTYSAELKDATADMSDYDFIGEIPLNLDGSWERYEDVYFEYETIGYELSDYDTYQSFPIANLSDAQGTATYQAYVKLPSELEVIEQLVLSIPYVEESVHIYLNGIKLEYDTPNQGYNIFIEESSLFSLVEAYDENSEYQILTICTNDENSDTDLFKREISISTETNILMYQAVIFSIEAFILLGMLISMVVAIIYILFYSGSKVLVLTNIFGCVLLLHITFGLTTVPITIFSSIFLDGYGDIIFAKIAKSTLILSLYIGNVLATCIFDPKKEVYPKLDKCINILIIGMACLSFVYPQIMNHIGVFMVCVLLFGTAVILLTKLKRIKDNKEFSNYYRYHYVKSILIGIIIFMDLVTINDPIRLREALLVAYLIFYVIILAAHGYEYQVPFTKLAERNELLEKLVSKRTKELTEVNNTLRSVSERDALTGAYNRLHFEEEFDRCFVEKLSSIYMYL